MLVRWFVTDKEDPKQTKGEMQTCWKRVACEDEGNFGSRKNSSERCFRGRASKCCWDFLLAMMFQAQKEEKLEMAIFDISRAQNMAAMDREACIELPQEARGR